MSKKNIVILAICFLAVAAIYYYLYRDSFGGAHIQISHTIRPTGYSLRHTTGDDEPTRVVIFGMDHNYQLTSIKVLSVPELQTNKYAHPLWELVSASNSIPIHAFFYGMNIKGMHPSVKGEKPGALDLNVPYRVIVEATGHVNGQHDFTVTEDDHVAH